MIEVLSVSSVYSLVCECCFPNTYSSVISFVVIDGHVFLSSCNCSMAGRSESRYYGRQLFFLFQAVQYSPYHEGNESFAACACTVPCLLFRRLSVLFSYQSLTLEINSFRKLFQNRSQAAPPSKLNQTCPVCTNKGRKEICIGLAR